MSRKNDFIIQIIGAEKSGKTKLAKAIALELKKYGVETIECPFIDDYDFSDINGKTVLITEFTSRD